MSDIKQLPSHLIDKIAAGEVVENPASVVKELIENALDARSTSLELAVEKGGTRLINLTDNGQGIPSGQVRLAFARHATSKISGEDDLRHIGSYGFRGEALPAMASVSIVDMTTATPEAAEGTHIVIEGGEEKLFEPAPARQGTSISVKQLFYNTPARRKFLKSETSEYRKIMAVVSRYSVCCFEKTIKLSSDGKEIVNYPGDTNLIDRLQRLWGSSVGARLIEIQDTPTDSLKISGLISHPSVNRGNRNQIYLMVNGRPIYDVSLMHAIRSAYGNTLDSGYFPLAAIFIEMDSTAVDVNVHPAKTEVRFADERYLYGRLKKLVEAAVQVPALFQVGSSARDSRPQPNVMDKVYRPPVPQGNIAQTDRPASKMIIRNGHNHYHPPDIKKEINRYEEVPPEGEEQFDIGGERFWQLYNTYVMGFREGKIWMIDQHTAHERVLYEAALNNLYERPGSSQRLLFDLTIELDPQDIAIFEKYKDLLDRLGFEIELFGNRGIIVRGVPAYFERSSIEKVFRDLLSGFIESLNTGEDPMMAMAASLACHAAIRAGESLSQEQMQGLFTRLFECQEPFKCPHGRPTVVTISREDLEKIFKRR